MSTIFSGDGISPIIGQKLYAQTFISDDSGEAMGSGGVQTLVLGSFGTGKSTLLCWIAQLSRYMVKGSKESYIHRIVHKKNTSKYKTSFTTVVWRARDQDNWPSMIPQNWNVREPGVCGKKVALFIHKDDKERVALYILENHVVKPIPHMPRPIYYSSADDLIGKIKEHYVNVVVEPQGYRISPRLAAVIMEAKAEFDNGSGNGNDQHKQIDDEKKDGMDEIVKNMRRPGGQKKVADYTKHAVKTGMFWFDFTAAETALWGNKPLMQVFDESDDFLSSGADLAWWGTTVWTESMRDFRKSNLSTVLSTHGWNLLADAIYKRVTHKIMLPGIKTGKNTMIKYSQTINSLPKGQFIIELANREFGVSVFSRISDAIMGRIDGLRGSYPALDADKRKWLWGEYEKAWALEENPPKPKIVPDVINIDPPKEICCKNLPMVIEQPTQEVNIT